MISQQIGNIQLMVFPKWKDHSILFHAFTTRKGGVSRGDYKSLNLGYSVGDEEKNVRENRRHFLKVAGIPESRTVMAFQVHGTNVERVEEPGVIENCDGLLTTKRNLFLVIGVADCHTIFLTNRKKNFVGALHAGWRGTAQKILTNAVDIVTSELNEEPEDLEVGISPAIGQCCYEVGNEVAEKFDQSALESRNGSHYLSLVNAIFNEAVDSGIPGQQIYTANSCTSCESDKYFSYRRDNGNTGRMWGVIGIL